ncbi:hypothetical protein ACFWNN_04175 [Lentzea sp. NPDC058450]|uniref:hypothetical protein n=1 Tax=Lentzea sp. NPDC058450 TaxID=3346505 RepID=UPI00366150D3
MTAFACKACGTVVTADLTEVAFPADAPGDEPPVPRLDRGTFALDPDPFGPPSEPSPDNPQIHVWAGPRETVLIHPEDARNLRRHRDRSRLNGCCDLDGLDGPNLVCGNCGAELATERSDCWVTWHDVRLQPEAVTRDG